MKSIKLSYDLQASGVSRQELDVLAQRLQPAVQKIKAAIGTGYETDYASVNLSADHQMIDDIQTLVAQKRQQINPTVLVVIGIGGSNLGTLAVHEALNSTLYNEFTTTTKIYFVDTVDTDYTSRVLQLVESILQQEQQVLVNVVTKSGTTTETIVNFHLFFALLKKYRPQKYADYVVVTSDHLSPLLSIAKQENMAMLAVPEKVGGRYSVLSPVGLFPLGMIGIDIGQLCAGALHMLDTCVQNGSDNNPAALSAAVVYAQYQKGCIIHDTFLFSRDMRAIGDWYRQLVGESLGKKNDRDGNIVQVGITPTTSIGTNDLHSVTQLYLGGPRDKFTTFVTIAKNKQELFVPKIKQFEKLVSSIQSRSVASIMDAIVQGVYRAYQKESRPFVSIILPEKSPFYIGQLLQMKMIEVMYLGHLLNINPFDQPQVELYKKETRTILAGS